MIDKEELIEEEQLIALIDRRIQIALSPHKGKRSMAPKCIHCGSNNTRWMGWSGNKHRVYCPDCKRTHSIEVGE